MTAALVTHRFRLPRLVLVLALAGLAAGAFNLTRQAEGAGAPAVVPSSAASALPSGPPIATNLHGTPGNDALTAPRAASTIHAGAGADTISSANGLRDVVHCGAGLDSVTADRVDALSGCEFVVRIES